MESAAAATDGLHRALLQDIVVQVQVEPSNVHTQDSWSVSCSLKDIECRKNGTHDDGNTNWLGGAVLLISQALIVGGGRGGGGHDDECLVFVSV
jgi:hypothetical protein